MADSFTALLRLRQQTTGANNNTWGALNNAAVIQLLEDSLAGRVEKVVAGVDITLSTNNGSSDEARKAIIVLTGSPGATRNIIIPNLSKLYVFDNQTNAIQNVKTSTGTALALPIGDRKIVMCDGANNVVGVADTLGGLDASVFARRDVQNLFAAGNADVPVAFVDGANITINTLLANVWSGTLGGDRTILLTNPVGGTWLEIYATQDATGGRDLTWPANVQWEGGVAPVMAGIPNTTSYFRLRYFADTLAYIGTFVDDIATTGGGGAVTDLSILSNDFNVDIFARAGSPAGPVTITVTIEEGVLITSADPATPALDFAGFFAASVINIINRGMVSGHGGKGGRGGMAGDANSANLFNSATAGTPGGDAIRLPSSACTISIDNGDGRIFGGGGGGGGGGPSHNADGSDVGATGGGGGGGAGSGIPGDGGSICAAQGAPGVSGGNGLNGTFGAGGAGTSSGGTGASATGGAGGDWGTVGTTGQAQTAFTFDAPAGVGGAAGKAINVNGGTAPVFLSGSGPTHVKGAVA